MGSSRAVGVWAWSKRGGKAAVVYTTTILLLLVLIQWPLGGYSPQDSLPSTSPDEYETMDTDPPAAPVLASTILAGTSSENGLITWSLSADDGAGDHDVSHYAIYLSDAYDYDGDGYSYLGQAGSGETSFTHSLAGDGDWLNHFYYVQANDTSGNGNWSGQAGKFVRFLEKGKHLASVPLVQEDTTLEVVLQTLAGSFKHVRYYKSSDQSNHWKTYWTFKTYRTLFDIDHRMGFWIDMTKDDHLVVAGLVPEMTQIELGHNWNLVGYPSFIDRTVSDALAGIDWQKVQGWGDTPPHHQKQMGASDIMTAGEGYWIWVDLPQVWEVYNRPADPPYIINTYPVNGAINVPVDTDIHVNFSEDMDGPTVGLTTVPACPSSWTPNMQTPSYYIFTCAEPFPEGQSVIATAAGNDLSGLPLVAPTQWTFITVSVPPMIVATDPFDGTVNVLLDAPIVVAFSEPMKAYTFSWTIVPDPGGWSSPKWSSGNTTVTLSHAVPFAEGTMYKVNVTYAEDLSGIQLVPGPVPNPFTFVTPGVGPYIVSTDPYDREVGVELDRDISILFSEPMDTSSLAWAIVPAISMNAAWYQNDTMAVLSPSDPFMECTTYTLHITIALDKDGYPLVSGPVPNPWSFSTTGIGTCPYVVLTDPHNNQTKVSVWQAIWIEFSWSMNWSSFSWEIDPDPGGWSPVWPSDRQIYLNHNNSFQPATTHVFQIVYIEDIYGVPLCGLPFTLTFKTSP